MILCIMPVIFALDTDYQGERNSNLTITLKCNLNNTRCSDSTLCNASVIYPLSVVQNRNSIFMFSNKPMTNLGYGLFTINLNDTTHAGVHNMYVDCTDSANNNSGHGEYTIDITGFVMDFDVNNIGLKDQYSRYYLLIALMVITLILTYFGYKFREFVFVLIAGLLWITMSGVIHTMNMYLGIIFLFLGIVTLLLSLKFWRLRK